MPTHAENVRINLPCDQADLESLLIGSCMDRGTRASETSPRAPTEGWSPVKSAESVPQSTTESIDAPRLTISSEMAPRPVVPSDKARQEKQEALTENAGFLLRLFPRQRRHAELGYLLPSPIGPAVKTRCIGPSSWLASYLYCSKVLRNEQ